MNLLQAVAVLVLSGAAVAGEPWARHTIDGSSRGADGVRLADVNGDGRLDIATGWEEGGVIRAYLNPGPRQAKEPWPAVTAGSVASPEDAVFADLDGDGGAEVVSCCEGRNRTIFVHWAPPEKERLLEAGAWTTQPIPATEGRQMWMFCLPMQIDGRRGIDLVVGAKGEGATIGWLESPENPRDLSTWKLHAWYDAGWIMSLAARDMDDDGDLDVLASDRKGRTRGVLWLENPGEEKTRAGAEWAEHRVGGEDSQVMFLVVAPAKDSAAANKIYCATSGGGILQFHRRETTWQADEIAMPDGCGTGKGVAAGDLDGDGRLDLVFSCENAGGGKSGVRWLSPPVDERQAGWQDHEISGPEGVKFDRLELLDLDADGDLDVLTCEERDGLGVFWYENPSRAP